MINRLVTVLCGIWLMLSPAVLGYGGAAENNDRLIGPIVASFAFVAIWEVARSVRWAVVPFALWMPIAAFVLDYPEGPPQVSAAAAGILAIVTTLPQSGDPSRFGGGWTSLWRK
jgi:hypothetical protein